MEGVQEIKDTLLLRIWHSFNSEKLQNVDGVEGNDLLPLPNTEKLPYVDKLFETSKIAPTLMIYSGNLSEKQKQMFEDLHKQAKERGGALFVVNYDKIKSKLKYHEMLNLEEIENDCRAADYGEYLSPKADFIDLQRLILLYDMNVIFECINEKYELEHEFRKLLYLDYDRDAQPVLDLMHKANENIQNTTDGVKLPTSISPEEGRSNQFMIQVENNFIHCSKNNSPFIKDIFDEMKSKSNIFAIICKIGECSLKDSEELELVI